jgi:hypothetical protein
MKPKTCYRTTNWPAYNRALIHRGDLTVWVSPDLAWQATHRTGQRGRPATFTDAAIQCVLTLKGLFRLPLRAAQGLTASLLRLLELDWPTPHYSTLSRRQADLTVVIPYRREGPLHLVIDSTGLKVLGEGEWKVRRHGAEYRRVWRKVHLAVDAGTHEIRAVMMTDHRHGDGEVLPDLLAQIPMEDVLASVSGDGAYDTRGVYRAIGERQAAVVVPPRRNGKPWETSTPEAKARNEVLRTVGHLGRRLWKRWSGYHQRSLAETAMFRLKQLGDRLSARRSERQNAEVHIRCAILNTFTRLGMPVTVALA